MTAVAHVCGTISDVCSAFTHCAGRKECLHHIANSRCPPKSDVPRAVCVQVIVKPAADSADCDSGAGSTSSSWSRQPLPAYLPQPQPAHTANTCHCSTFPRDMQTAVQLQLLNPQPGTLLEADRTQEFAVLAPPNTTVAVGSAQSGWLLLQPQQQEGTSTADYPSAVAAGPGLCVFAGRVVLPRVNTCFVAVSTPVQQAGEDCSSEAGSSWAPVLGLHVWPPVSAALC